MRRRISKRYLQADAEIEMKYKQREQEELKKKYLSEEPVYEIVFDDGTRYWMNEKDEPVISKLSFASLWGGKEHFTEDEIKRINPSYLRYAKRYLG